MERPNIVVLVLDTLRQDAAKLLDALSAFGYVSYSNMISPSPWTLPSHASMFTGVLPSMHTVHEGLGTYASGMIGISRRVLSQSQSNILSMLKTEGYSTYGVSANPWISPAFGFEFDEYYGNDSTVAEQAPLLWDSPSVAKSARTLVKTGSFGTLLRLSGRKATASMQGFFGRQQMEKGSAAMISHLRRQELTQPFFLFVNFMEAHEPYRFGEDARDLLPCYLGRPVNLGWWKEVYPIHADFAVRRGLEFLAEIAKYDPVVIVTSDHGQLLGENGHFGHGYFLDEPLLRVPLYIRTPDARWQPRRTDSLASLSDIHGIIDAIAHRETPQFGSQYVMAESFGCHRDLSGIVQDKSTLEEVYMHRTRVFTKQGSLVFNRNSGIVEQSTGKLSQYETTGMVEAIGQTPEVKTSSSSSQMPADEAIVMNRLRDWGYE